MQLVSKISNLCGPDPLTSLTDGQTDDTQSPYRTLHYSASRGKNEHRPTKIRRVEVVYCVLACDVSKESLRIFASTLYF